MRKVKIIDQREINLLETLLLISTPYMILPLQQSVLRFLRYCIVAQAWAGYVERRRRLL